MSKNYLRTSLDKYRKDQAICKCGHILGQHPMFDRNTVKIRCSAFGCECPNFDLLELPNGIVGKLYGITIDKDFNAITGEEILNQ